MKYFYLILLSSLMTGASSAPGVQWDYSGTDHLGFWVYCEPTPIAGNPLSAQIADPAARNYDLSTIPGCVVDNVEIETWITAYNADYQSNHSNHLVITPASFNRIVVPGPVNSLTITWE